MNGRCATVGALLIGSLLGMPVGATPYVPAADNDVLERLPDTVADGRARELRGLRNALTTEPDNLTLAVQLASDYIEIGRITGDPRYAGYAQSALAPWWQEPTPPVQVLVLRAQLRQRVHAFAAALADLDLVLNTNPREARARLLRATIRQVIGDYPRAAADCAMLARIANPLLGTQCRASVMSLTGALPAAYALLAPAATQSTGLDAGTAAWILTSLADMAERLGDPVRATALFKQALALTPTDQYLLIAYADFLLAEGRAEEALPLLAPYPRVDGLLLRYALALHATGADNTEAVAQLRARFAASAARGETVHRREQARFVLEIEHDPVQAVHLALDNWAVQKEPADLRILVAAARAAQSEAALTTARDWIADHHLQDFRLASLRRSARR
ncbi:MAG: tetratricopeptide repeat protein [Gammaproteobacteria bacterium]|nr:tetratricopeptide repeat protein [Gammaproteobacteria bacterium]